MYPNKGSDKSKYRFTNRFFIIDNVSGIANNGYLNKAKPNVIFYSNNYLSISDFQFQYKYTYKLIKKNLKKYIYLIWKSIMGL